MDTRAIIEGAVTATPNTTPTGNAAVLPIAVNNRGVQWVNLVVAGVQVTGVANNADGVSATATLGNVPTVTFNYLWDGANWDRARTQDLSASSFTPAAAVGGQQIAGCNYGHDGGTDWHRIGVATATRVAALSGANSMLTAMPGEWAINHAPAANTIATITRAAGGAGVRHVCKGFSVSINAVAAIAAPLVVNLRDGATGAGTILWTERLMAPAGVTFTITRDGLNIPGSANTAMTLEFTAAPGATNFENVNLNGISSGG